MLVYFLKLDGKNLIYFQCKTLLGLSNPDSTTPMTGDYNRYGAENSTEDLIIPILTLNLDPDRKSETSQTRAPVTVFVIRIPIGGSTTTIHR